MEDTTDSKAIQPYSAKWWHNELHSTDKELDKKWKDKAHKVVARYLDDREEEPTGPMRKYNIFWANVQILKSALYATPPKPEVKRQHGDAKDDVARTAALILERLLQRGVSTDYSDGHGGIDHAVEDLLIPGAGQVWLRYEPTIVNTEIAPGVKADVVTNEEAPVDYVHWDDFIWAPARVWSEVSWVARRVWMGRSKFVSRFGEQLYTDLRAKVESEAKSESLKLPKGFRKGKVEVYEIWCKETHKAYWISPADEDLLLDSKDDPLRLKSFFPCPKPLLATHTTNDLLPRPDYIMMQDQYHELDTLNDRINTLTKALRVVGAYDKNNTELAKMVTGGEFNMIPVENWAMLSEQGGMAKSVDWFPVEQVQKVLAGLVEQRVLVVGQIYELSGISDIMRGASNPRETAKAQTLKAQYSSVRLQLKQQAVGQFVRELLRLRAEIICTHFQPQNIIKQSMIQQTDSAQFAEPAVVMLKNYQESEYRIEVTEQSLSIADYNAERELRMELITALGQFLSQTASTLTEMPQAMPYMLRIIQWVVASFRGAGDIESVLDEAVASVANMPPKQEPAPPPPPPDKSVEVAQVKASADVQIAKLTNDSREKIAAMQLAQKTNTEESDRNVEVTEDSALTMQVQKLIEGVQQLLQALGQGATSTGATAAPAAV